MASQAQPWTDDLETLFMKKLKRYLRGVGYPEGLDNENLGAQLADDVVSSCTFRAQQFLYMATGTETPPSADDWAVKVDIHCAYGNVTFS